MRLSGYFQANFFFSTSRIDNILSSQQELSNILTLYDGRPRTSPQISSSEEALSCLKRITDDFRELRLSLNKPTYNKTGASSDLAPDPPYNLDSVRVIAQGFYGPSNHQWDQIMLRNFMLQIQLQAVPVSDLSVLN